MKPSVRPLAAALLLSVLSLPAVAAKGPSSQAKVAPASKVASVEGITEYALENGLRVLLFPDPAKQTTTVNVTYLVGSRHEDYGETGMAHLLEHLLFKGSTNHRDIPQELTAHGCRPNGSTWFDRTNYFETFAASDENLAWALDLEADRMVNSFISKKDLDSEMTVVRNEFESGENDPSAVLGDRLFSAAYLWHNYGKTTIGARADLENVPIERLQAFYRRYYRPDNAVLVVAGKFDEAKALELVRRTFGAIPRPKAPIPVTYTVDPAQDGEREFTLRRVGDSQIVTAGWHVVGGSHPDFAVADLLAFVLADTPSGRLHKALVEPGKAAEVSGVAYSFRDPSMLVVSADVRTEGSLEEAEEILLRTVEEAAAKGFSSEELERARTARLRDWDATIRHAERAGIELSEWSALGDWRLIFVHRDRLKAVTTDDLRRVAAAYLRRNNRTVGRFVPTKVAERVEIPANPDVVALVRDYRGEAGLSAGEAFDVSPSAIEARTLRSVLPSGLRTVLVPKKTRGGTVSVNLQLGLGDVDSLRGRIRAGEMAGSMLMRGTAGRTRQQIADEVDRLKAKMSVDGSATGAWATLETTREHLPAALRLAAELLREPSFPAAELELLRQEELVAIEEGRNDPGQIAGTAVSRHYRPYPADDPRYTATPDEAVARTKGVTVEEIRAFHADFYGMNEGARIAVVGDFDPKATSGLLAELFGTWKSRKGWTRIPNPLVDARPLVAKLEAPDKESAVVSGRIAVGMTDTDADYAGAVLGAYMTGGGFLNSRLARRIRQKDGISYGVGGFFQASAFEPDASFGIYAIYAPQNSRKLETAVDEELRRVVGSGFAAEEIAEAKSGWLQSRKVSRSGDSALANTLTQRELQRRTLMFDEELEKKVSALTAEEIHAAMKKVLRMENLTLVQAGDFARAAKDAAAAPAK